MAKSYVTDSGARDAYTRLDKLLQVSGAPHRFHTGTSCVMVVKDKTVAWGPAAVGPVGPYRALQMSTEQWTYYALILRELGGIAAINSAVGDLNHQREFLQYRIAFALEEDEGGEA